MSEQELMDSAMDERVAKAMEGIVGAGEGLEARYLPTLLATIAFQLSAALLRSLEQV